MLEIRKMELQDLPEVAALEEAIFSLPWSRQGFEAALLARNTLYLAAVMDGSIAGYCGLLQCMDEAQITNVAVRAECRRQGVAWAMLRELLQRGAEGGVRAFTLEVRAGNQAAIALYQKLGFQSCGIRPNFYERPREDAVIMWKR